MHSYAFTLKLRPVEADRIGKDGFRSFDLLICMDTVSRPCFLSSLRVRVVVWKPLQFDATVPSDLAEVSVDVVYPASAKHIAKATDQQFVMATHVTPPTSDGRLYPSQEKYGLGEEKLRIFVHYQPTYYHFHVHFVHTSHVGMGIAAGQAHLLDDIIGEQSQSPDWRGLEGVQRGFVGQVLTP
eukprot:1247841-Pyramimonas_sp.AAC.3